MGILKRVQIIFLTVASLSSSKLVNLYTTKLCLDQWLNELLLLFCFFSIRLLSPFKSCMTLTLVTFRFIMPHFYEYERITGCTIYFFLADSSVFHRRFCAIVPPWSKSRTIRSTMRKSSYITLVELFGKLRWDVKTRYFQTKSRWLHSIQCPFSWQ